ncbi:hypothetical protein BWI96_15140 [Siphonobacter sp. SORGH_AS_0500]|uniref:sugar 3,4-ketoisomerase n=1 Tax=Siphonobacter sp. SORGH_AS_0500 TaxID=1864824 RepID=UPI000CAA188E|nr:FdtA/QdtA family cupin domain-containing protein [Siphonobacter sp. SORGH_AS_0500]PKK35861.1 hypothetical protein BWI96_15140 [Siphonobacter sp. SORGH_AS_0500]
MATLLELNTFGTNTVDQLSVFEKILPGDIKRAFFVYGIPPDSQRAKYGHLQSHQALVCLNGSCRIEISNVNGTASFDLSIPQKCQVVEPTDWLLMDQLSKGLLGFSNYYYNLDDYFYQKT